MNCPDGNHVPGSNHLRGQSAGDDGLDLLHRLVGLYFENDLPALHRIAHADDPSENGDIGPLRRRQVGHFHFHFHCSSFTSIGWAATKAAASSPRKTLAVVPISRAAEAPIAQPSFNVPARSSPLRIAVITPAVNASPDPEGSIGLEPIGRGVQQLVASAGIGAVLAAGDDDGVGALIQQVPDLVLRGIKPRENARFVTIGHEIVDMRQQWVEKIDVGFETRNDNVDDGHRARGPAMVQQRGEGRKIDSRQSKKAAKVEQVEPRDPVAVNIGNAEGRIGAEGVDVAPVLVFGDQNNRPARGQIGASDNARASDPE